MEASLTIIEAFHGDKYKTGDPSSRLFTTHTLTRTGI